MLAGLAAVGCATREPASPRASTERTQAPTGQRSPSTHLTGTPSKAPKIAASARVVVTGVLLRRGDVVEVCPGQGVGACPGIRVEGKVQNAWLSEPGKVSVWRLSGAFDGATLVLDAPSEANTLAKPPDYRNSCAEFQKPTKGVNPEPRLSQTVEAFAREHTERIAGKWWDRERQTMVISITGDPSELRRRFAERAPEARVCIQGQARFSEVELERSRAKADGILRDHGVVWSGSGGDVVRNEILYEVDAIDARTLAELARDAGAGIHVVAFIELLDHDLSQMPVPAAHGNVTLVTTQTRSGAGMSALGRFRCRSSTTTTRSWRAPVRRSSSAAARSTSSTRVRTTRAARGKRGLATRKRRCRRALRANR